jgi:hypothetical protein
MILGLTRPLTTKLAVIVLAISLARLLSGPARLSASTSTKPSPAVRSTPEVFVRVYSFPGLTPWMLQGAKTVAGDILRSASIGMHWVDCTSQVPSVLQRDRLTGGPDRSLPRESVAPG